MNYYVKTGLKTILATVIILTILIGSVIYMSRSKEVYDINKERFRQYNDSPLYFHKYIQTSLVYKQKHK